jgi:MFS family permease
MRSTFPAARRLAANRPLAAVVVANGISGIGDWLYLTMLPLLVYAQTGDAALVGLVGACRLLPWLLLSIPAGALVDRHPGPRLLVVTESTRASLMLVMAGLAACDAPLAVLLVVAVAAVVAGTVAMPAHGRLVPQLADSDESLAAANVVQSTLDNLACVIGPAIAGVLVLAGGFAAAFAINGLSFVGVLGVLVWIAGRVTPPSTGEGATARETPSGTGDVRLASIVRAASPRLILDAAVSFAAGALLVLPVLLATEGLALGEEIVGLFGVLAGLGGIVGAGVAGRFIHGRQVRGMALGAAILPLAIAIAAGPSLLLAVAGLSVAAAALVALDTLNTTELQRTTPTPWLGRTLGVLHTSAATFAIAGSAFPGLALEAFGIGPASQLTAGIVALLGVSAFVGPRVWGAARSRSSSLRMSAPSPKRLVSG